MSLNECCCVCYMYVSVLISTRNQKYIVVLQSCQHLWVNVKNDKCWLIITLKKGDNEHWWMLMHVIPTYHELLTSFRSTETDRSVFLEISWGKQFHTACHCFGSQRSTVALLLSARTLTCCGIRARGWALRWFISVSMDIITLEREMCLCVLQLDTGTHRLCSAKVHVPSDHSSYLCFSVMHTDVWGRLVCHYALEFCVFKSHCCDECYSL